MPSQKEIRERQERMHDYIRLDFVNEVVKALLSWNIDVLLQLDGDGVRIVNGQETEPVPVDWDNETAEQVARKVRARLT